MRPNRQTIVLAALSIAGFLTLVSPAEARPIYRHKEKTVIRGRWGAAHSLLLSPGTVGGNELFSDLTFREISPLTFREVYRTSDSSSSLREIIQQEVARVRETSAATEAQKSAGSSSVGNTPATTATTTSSAYSDLSKRMDKIEERVGKIETQVKDLDAKVTQLLKGKEGEEQKKLIASIVIQANSQRDQELDKNLAARDKKLAAILRLLPKPMAEGDQKKLDALLKDLEGNE
jgi:hypothetical protein